MKPVRQSISLAITERARKDAVLIVQRPPDDAELPNVWGLPAASLQSGESWEDAALRAGRDKLGVVLDIASELDHDSIERDAYVLEMKLFAATILSGMPSAPQPHGNVTQYQHWKWGVAADLEDAARKGSLCSAMYLEWDQGRLYPAL